MRVLIAEDDFMSRNILRDALTNIGHDVIDAKDGTEAWQILTAPSPPKLVILDWVMPGMDGVTVIKKARETEGEEIRPYMILVTTKGSKNDIIEGLDAGADDYLTKPYDIGELTARVNVGIRMVELQEVMAKQVQDLRQAMEHIQVLEDILPICSYCKKIRNETGDWNAIDMYVSEHLHARFSHGICPDCMKKYFPKIQDK